MSPRSVVITGANRGIGLELVKQWLKCPDPPLYVIGTYRDSSNSQELLDLTKSNADQVHAIQFDASNMDSYETFADKVAAIVGQENGLNVLMNNAAYMAEKHTLDDITPDEMKKSFAVNCVAPMFITKSFLPLLKTASNVNDKAAIGIEKAAVIQMSTAVASILENTGGTNYAYRASKTALNMVMKTLSVDLKDTGILIMSMHPGWVKTRMGGPNALIDTESCCSTMIQTLKGLTEKDHGSFLRYNNTPIPW